MSQNATSKATPSGSVRRRPHGANNDNRHRVGAKPTPGDALKTRWGFVNGESHTDMEDALLERIDAERAEARAHDYVKEYRDRCAVCKDSNVPVTLVRGELICLPCRREMYQPIASEEDRRAQALTRARKRGGPYYVQIPGEEKPRLIDADTQRLAREIVARKLGRRLPNGTRVWAA